MKLTGLSPLTLVKVKAYVSRTLYQAQKLTFRQLRRPRINLVLLLGVLALAFGLRIDRLTGTSLWGDEAESSINALTILVDSFPTDHYLQLPLYENILTEKWPESKEYGYRDSSYAHGVAVYHGWLPLYSIAASLRAFGIQPAKIAAARPSFGSDERRRRTLAARFPSVLFGVMTVLGIYLAMAELVNVETALAVGLLTAILNVAIQQAQQARYYAATEAAISLCIWSTACLVSRESWRNIVVGAAMLVLLFYCHLLSFFIALLVMSTVLLVWLIQSRDRQKLGKVAVFYLIIIGSCAPWLYATGFLTHVQVYSQAWHYLTLPWDLLFGSFAQSEFGIALLGSLLVVAAAWFRRTGQFTEANQHNGVRIQAFLLLFLWSAVSYLAFFFGMPVASFFTDRLALILLPPCLILFGMTCRCLAETVTQKHRATLTTGLLLGFGALSNWHRPLPSAAEGANDWMRLDSILSFLENSRFAPSTRLYASGNEHLRLMFYSGMRVQSFAPIRKEFINDYSGQILFLESQTGIVDYESPNTIEPESLMQISKKAGAKLEWPEAQRLSCELESQEFRSLRAAWRLPVTPALRKVPWYATSVFAQYEQKRYESRASGGPLRNNPVLRKRALVDDWGWWHQFFFFFDTQRREEKLLSYPRLQTASVTVLPCTEWVIYDLSERVLSAPGQKPQRASASAIND